MSRYIEEDALELPYGYCEDATECYKALNDAPSIDIVRCKECKHNPWDFDRTDYTCVWDDDFADRPQTPDDFCSYGERSE